MFGKFENGKFIRAPHRITEEEALAFGYKPVILTPSPDTDDEHYPVESLEETDIQIIRHWSVEPFPVDPDPEVDEAEAFDIIFGGAE